MCICVSILAIFGVSSGIQQISKKTVLNNLAHYRCRVRDSWCLLNSFNPTHFTTLQSMKAIRLRAHLKGALPPLGKTTPLPRTHTHTEKPPTPTNRYPPLSVYFSFFMSVHRERRHFVTLSPHLGKIIVSSGRAKVSEISTKSWVIVRYDRGE